MKRTVGNKQAATGRHFGKTKRREAPAEAAWRPGQGGDGRGQAHGREVGPRHGRGGGAGAGLRREEVRGRWITAGLGSYGGVVLLRGSLRGMIL